MPVENLSLEYCVHCFTPATSSPTHPVMGLCMECCARFAEYPVDDYNSTCILMEMDDLLHVMEEGDDFEDYPTLGATFNVATLSGVNFQLLKHLQHDLVDGLKAGYAIESDAK